MQARQYGSGYQTCGYKEVCCRYQQPDQYSSHQTPSQYNGHQTLNQYSTYQTPNQHSSTFAAGTCGRRNPSGINTHIEGDSEFGK